MRHLWPFANLVTVIWVLFKWWMSFFRHWRFSWMAHSRCSSTNASYRSFMKHSIPFALLAAEGTLAERVKIMPRSIIWSYPLVKSPTSPLHRGFLSAGDGFYFHIEHLRTALIISKYYLVSPLSSLPDNHLALHHHKAVDVNAQREHCS